MVNEQLKMEDYPAPNDDADMHNELLGAAYNEPGFFFNDEIAADEMMGAPHV